MMISKEEILKIFKEECQKIDIEVGKMEEEIEDKTRQRDILGEIIRDLESYIRVFK